MGRYRCAAEPGRENQPMAVRSAQAAVGLFDPALASAAADVRRVLAQARRSTQLDESGQPLTPALRHRLTHHHRIGPLVHKYDPSPEGHALDQQLMLGQLRLSSIARDVGQLLTEADIDLRILKGLATSELDYSIPSLRHTADVDVLVGRESIDRATSLLLDAGFRAANEADRDTGQMVDGSNLKGVVLLHESGVEIDLHYRLSRFVPHDEANALFDDASPLRFGLTALSPEGRLIHAASHSVLSPQPSRRLSSLADIVAILDNTGVNWARARRLADRIGLTSAAGAALRAEALIMGRDRHPGQEWPPPSAGQRWLIETRRNLVPLQHLLAMQALPTTVSRRGYISQRVTPGVRARVRRRRSR